MITLSLETDYKIKLPLDWVKELGLEPGVVIERTNDGILIRSSTTQSCASIYAEKLKMGTPSALDSALGAIEERLTALEGSGS